MPQERLMRSETDRMIAGVCGGLSAHLGIDSVFVRLAFVVLILASGIGLPIYLVLWVVMPDASRSAAAGSVSDENAYVDPSSLKQRPDNPARTVGIIMVLFGGFFLLSQFGWISNAFWPILLIGAGLFVILRRARQS